jgi:hypothetical protein
MGQVQHCWQKYKMSVVAAVLEADQEEQLPYFDL